jgi:hypothetical protein
VVVAVGSRQGGMVVAGRTTRPFGMEGNESGFEFWLSTACDWGGGKKHLSEMLPTHFFWMRIR